MQRLLIGVAFFQFGLTHILAQNTAYTSGLEFVTIYTEPHKNLRLYSGGPYDDFDTNVYTQLHIIGANAGCATISIPGLGFSQQVFVPKDSVVTVTLPYNPIYAYETPINRGIKVTSSTPIALIQSTGIGKGGGAVTLALNNARSVSASAIIPSMVFDSSSVNYVFFSNSAFIYNYTKRTSGFEMCVVSLQNSNEIEIFFGSRTFLPPNLGFGAHSIAKDSTLLISLDSLSQMSFFTVPRSPNEESNSSYIISLNGLKYKSFFLTQDHRAFDDGPGIGYAYEDAKPSKYYGTSYHTAPIASSLANQYSFMAIEDSTVVFCNGIMATVLDSLGRMDTCIAGPLHITSNKPVAGFMAGCNNAFNNNNSESPLVVSLSSDNEVIKESHFLTLDETDSLNHYMLGVVTKTKNAQLFKLNGTPIGSAIFTPFGADSAWSWANIELQKGIHKAQSDSGFHAFQYTYYNAKPPGYAFPSYGYNLPQSITWPQDSFVFRAGLDSNSLQPFSSFNQTLCLGQTLYVQASHLRHTTWQWAFGDGNTQTQRVGSKRAEPISYTWQSPGQYWVTITDSAGCTAGDSLLVIVENGPQAAFSYTANSSCSGTFVQLQNETIGATNYAWQWPGGSSTAQNPSFSYNGQDTTLTVTLIATDGTCSDTAVQNLKLQISNLKQEDIPNVLSPNNDGINDAFCIPCTVGYQACFQLEVFNRWGRQVFKTTDPQDCWEPTNLADGVYFYVLTLGKQQYQGEVTLF